MDVGTATHCHVVEKLDVPVQMLHEIQAKSVQISHETQSEEVDARELLRVAGGVDVGCKKARVDGKITIEGADARHAADKIRRGRCDRGIRRCAIKWLELIDAQFLSELDDACFVISHNFRKVFALHDGKNDASHSSCYHCHQNNLQGHRSHDFKVDVPLLLAQPGYLSVCMLRGGTGLHKQMQMRQWMINNE